MGQRKAEQSLLQALYLHYRQIQIQQLSSRIRYCSSCKRGNASPWTHRARCSLQKIMSHWSKGKRCTVSDPDLSHLPTSPQIIKLPLHEPQSSTVSTLRTQGTLGCAQNSKWSWRWKERKHKHAHSKEIPPKRKRKGELTTHSLHKGTWAASHCTWNCQATLWDDKVWIKDSHEQFIFLSSLWFQCWLIKCPMITHMHLGAGHSPSRFTAGFYTNGICFRKTNRSTQKHSLSLILFGFLFIRCRAESKTARHHFQSKCWEAAWAEEPALHYGSPCPHLPISSCISRRVGHSPNGNSPLAPVHSCRQTS